MQNLDPTATVVEINNSGNSVVSSSHMAASSSNQTPHATQKPPSTLELTSALGIPSRTKSRRVWTPEEDEQLRLLVSYWGDQCGKNGHWDKISAHFPNRTNKDCRKRWFHSLDPKLKRGRWTEHEDKVLVEAYSKMGPVWHRIAQLIPGRTDDQCSKRYNDVLDPSISNRLRPWSEEEDQMLLSLVQKYGTKWRTIANEMEGRTGLTCRNRWRKIVSRAVKETPRSSGLKTNTRNTQPTQIQSGAIPSSSNPMYSQPPTGIPIPTNQRHTASVSSSSSVSSTSLTPGALRAASESPSSEIIQNSENMSSSFSTRVQQTKIPISSITHNSNNNAQQPNYPDETHYTFTLPGAKDSTKQHPISAKELEALMAMISKSGQEVVIHQHNYHYHHHHYSSPPANSPQPLDIPPQPQQQPSPNKNNNRNVKINPTRPSISEDNSEVNSRPTTPGGFLDIDLMDLGEEAFADFNGDFDAFGGLPFNPS